MWRGIWFGALSVLLALELWTLANDAPGDTLSEQVVPLLEHPVVWAATLLVWLVFAVWLTRHWWGHPSRRDRDE